MLQGTIAEEKETAFTACPVRCHSGKELVGKINRYGSSFLGGCRADLIGHTARNCIFFDQIEPLKLSAHGPEPRLGSQGVPRLLPTRATSEAATDQAASLQHLFSPTSS